MINSFRGEYYFLSNFYNAPIIYKGISYQNSEAAFQAQKCLNDNEKLMFSTLSPYDAKRLGRKVALRSDWESIKFSVMQKIVDAKFDQNPDIANKLIMTNDEYLEEGNNWGDKIWGTVNGVGANNLGKILMQTRERLKEVKHG